MLDKKIGVNQPKRMENLKILIANTGMDTDKVKVRFKCIIVYCWMVSFCSLEGKIKCGPLNKSKAEANAWTPPPLIRVCSRSGGGGDGVRNNKHKWHWAKLAHEWEHVKLLQYEVGQHRPCWKRPSPGLIGDFGVAFCLSFKVTPSAKPFIWKLVLFTCKFASILWIKLNSYERLHTGTHFETEAKGNWHIVFRPISIIKHKALNCDRSPWKVLEFLNNTLARIAYM